MIPVIDVDAVALEIAESELEKITASDVKRYVEGDGCQDLTDSEYDAVCEDIAKRVRGASIEV